MNFSAKLFVLFSLLLCALSSLCQEVQVSPVKGGVQLSVAAQHSYQLMPGETKQAVLSVECLHKGKKASHLVVFSPGGAVVGSDADASAKSAQAFVVTINGKKHLSGSWMTYGEADSFAYIAPTEEQRMQFLQSLLGSEVSIEFKPFLTGTPTTATFDLSKLGDALNKQPGCSVP